MRRHASTTALAVAVACGLVLRFAGLPHLMVGRVVVVAADVGTGLLWLAALGAVVALARRPLPRDKPATRALVPVAVLALLAAPAAQASRLFDDTRTTVLSPGPNGCRVVVREWTGFVKGRGDVYVARRGEFVLRPAGHYVIDDLASPVKAGAYTLDWSGDVGTLTVMPSSEWPGQVRVGCG